MSRTKAPQLHRVEPLSRSPILSEEAAEVFEHLVRSMAPDHFSECDRPLLESYATAIVNARKAQAVLDRDGQVTAAGKISPWLLVLATNIKNIVSLSLRLRLSPSARFDRLKAGTTSRPQDCIYDDEDDPSDPDNLLARPSRPKTGLASFRTLQHLRPPHPDDDDELLA